MMAEGRRGLGRGLSALLGETDVVDAGAAAALGPDAGLREIPIEMIRANPHQPRRNFDRAEIESLAASLREKGVLQPILVRPLADSPGEYQIVAGERRSILSARMDKPPMERTPTRMTRHARTDPAPGTQPAAASLPTA